LKAPFDTPLALNVDRQYSFERGVGIELSTAVPCTLEMVDDEKYQIYASPLICTGRAEDRIPSN
jgi:hypothetical protein